MISTVTLSFDLTYTNPATGALEPRGIVTDSTDYAGLGIDLLIAQAKGLGVITFNGDVIENRNTTGNPMIDLQNWGTLNPGQTPVFYFPLELDLNGNVANGVYTFNYSLRLVGTGYQLFSNTLPDVIVTNGALWLNDFLEVGDTLTLVGATNENVTVISTIDSDPNVTITTSDYTLALINSYQFDITNTQLNAVYTYSGCTQTTADVSFTYDCEVGDSGSWAVANTTKLASNEVVSTLNCVVSYPSWTALTPTFNPQVVLTSLPYPSAPNTPTPLATGTYTVSLTQQIQQNQTDGLILLYTTSTAQEFVVSCSGSLCGLTPCIENLRVAHANELHRNRISKYQVFVDNVLLYYAEAQNYRACGDTANYRATLELIKQNLDASGCECACCDENLFYFVSNNSGVSVIDSLIESFQFRLFSLTPPAAGSPLLTDDVTKGVQEGAIWENTFTNVLYICLDNTVNNAQWVEFFNYQDTFTAAQISATPGTNLNTNNVQGQLTQADALFTVIDLNTTAIESDIADLQATALTAVAVDGVTITGDGTVGNPLIAVNTGPLVYAGRTRFSGASIAISEYGNTTGATISISNTGVGLYTITASSAVFTTDTIAFVQLQGAAGFTTALVATSSTITVRTYNAAGVLDDAVIATGSFIKIEVYS
jgi:hypothetical protein